MASLKEVRKKIGPDICRRCLNQVCNSSLNPDDCVYYVYPAPCSNCGEKRRIVVDLRWTGKCKLLFRKIRERDD